MSRDRISGHIDVLASFELLKIANLLIGESKWESPTKDRRTWRKQNAEHRWEL